VNRRPDANCDRNKKRIKERGREESVSSAPTTLSNYSIRAGGEGAGEEEKRERVHCATILAPSITAFGPEIGVKGEKEGGGSS